MPMTVLTKIEVQGSVCVCVYTCPHTHVVFDISVHPDLIPLVTKLQLRISEMREADGLEESPCSPPSGSAERRQTVQTAITFI